MNASKTLPSKTHLTVAHVLARLLERLEHSTVPVGAEQYRSVVLHLVSEFGGVPPDTDLGALLDAYPAAAQVYENINYTNAGLCRSSLDLSLATERQAKEAIAHAMRHSREDSDHG